LVEERSKIHYTMHLGRDHRPSASKLRNFLTKSHLLSSSHTGPSRIATDAGWR
jgi:hypothetical protein